MAKRGQSSESETETEVEQENRSTKPIPGTVLKKVISSLRHHQDEIDEIKGTMGGEVNAICGKYAISKKVIAAMRQLSKLSAEALSDYLLQYDHALSVSGLKDRAATVKRLPLGESGDQAEQKNGAEGGGDGGATAGGEPKNVTKFPAPAGATAS